MKSIKIISMDFDGSLLSSDKIVTDRTRKCLTNFKKKSYIIIGITARNLLSVKATLDVNLFDYIILNNGSDIYYVEENKIENVGIIDIETAQKIVDLCEDSSCEIDFCTSYNYLIKSKVKGDNRSFVRYIDGIDDIDYSISRMNVFFRDVKKVEEYKLLIEKSFDNLDVVKMLDTDKLNSRIWLTINPKNINKFSTLKRMCDNLKCSIGEVIFFGDSENDLVLIENAGIGVAMENALDIVKEKASYVTLSNDNDGIAEYLENNFE
ncbi:MAG: HAD-IIB family hydrolase [Bacilli bacterium]|nr:HAD-IIB family hydrolase [Bacilli bacterium]